jgi:predicted transposase/invertase (TIGR01784 family)
MCRINPRVDFAFKKLFGSEENKDLLISLINAIVSERDQVADIELKNPYNLADYQAGKMSILDIKAVDKTGLWYNIEMQVSEDLNFDKRALYYWARLVTEQLKEGAVYRQLKKTVSINILDFNFTPSETEFHNIYKICNTTVAGDDRFHDIFELHYIELRKFRKEYAELVRPLDRWLTFLTRAHELARGRVPESLSSDQQILKAIEAVDRMFDEEERLVYEERMRLIADAAALMISAEEKGMRKGREKGKAEGKAEGRAEGKAEGRAEGKAEGEQAAKIELARQLLDVLDDATIAAKTGLDRTRIEEMRCGTGK